MGALSRRAALVAGATLAAGLPTGASAHPDAELIAACRAYAAAIARYDAEGGHLEYDECPIYAALEAAEERAEAALPPRTFDGLRAVAELCRKTARRQADGEFDYSNSYCGDWLGVVVKGVLDLTPARA